MARQSLWKEYLLFVTREGKWWLMPALVILLALGAILILVEAAPALAPFVYTLF